MADELAPILNLSANIALAAFGAALALLVIWHDARRRSNQYFALCMLIFALYGVFDMAWQTSPHFDLDAEPLLYTATTFYIVGLILLFNFAIAFGGLPRRLRHIEHLISAPLAVVFLGLMWTGHIYDITGDATDYRITQIGLVGGLVAMAYVLSSILLLHRLRSPRAHALTLPLELIVLGIAFFLAASSMRIYSLNALLVTAAVVLLGRLVIIYQVFQPLADLNAQLSQRNEQLLRATQLKSQFLANMSHELRTPLNSIIGYTELVGNGTYGELSELQRDRLQKVARNGRLLLALINDVLDLSKIEAGRLTLEQTRVPTDDLLDSLLDGVEPRVLEKGLLLVRGYGKLPVLWADENRVRQILSNLLSNAIKFTEQGAIIVRGHYDAGRKQVVISVTDTGIGIDPANQERVFEAFQQADGALTRKYEGTGLGLAISRRLVELHGGRIWFESTPGKGTTFHVALPTAEELHQSPPMVLPGPRASGPLILAIDDNIEAIEVLQGHLEAAGFRVQGVSNPNDGIRLAHELLPALITLDIRMPNVNGWAVFDALRHDPETAHIPVIIITATDDRDVAQMVGAEGFLTKPVQPQLLLAHVRRLLEVQT